MLVPLRLEAQAGEFLLTTGIQKASVVSGESTKDVLSECNTYQTGNCFPSKSITNVNIGLLVISIWEYRYIFAVLELDW